MKKKIALLLAAVMTLSTLPMNLFAASKNDLTTTPGVIPDKTIFAEGLLPRTSVNIGGGVDYLVNAPYLRIKLGDTLRVNDTIKIKLTNAKWFFREEGYAEEKINEGEWSKLLLAEHKTTPSTIFIPGAPKNGSGKLTYDPMLGDYKLITDPNVNNDSNVFPNHTTVSTTERRNQVGGIYRRTSDALPSGVAQPTRTGGGNADIVLYDMYISGADDSYATITFKENPNIDATGAVAGYKDDEVLIPLVTRTTEKAEVMVNIENSNLTAISQQQLVFGQASGSLTKTYVADPQTARKEFPINKLVIKENRLYSLKNGDIEIIAPSGFYFKSNLETSDVKLYVEPGLSLTSGNTGIATKDYGFNDTVSSDTGTADYAIKFKSLDNREEDESVIQVRFRKLSTSNFSAGAVYFTGLVLLAENNAPWGDINLKIRNRTSTTVVTEEEFKAGERKDWVVSLSTITDVPTLVNGRYVRTSSADAEDSYHLAAKVRFEENATAAWWSERVTTFTLPEGVKIRKVKITKAENMLNDTEASPAIDYNDRLKYPTAGRAFVGYVTGANSTYDTDAGYNTFTNTDYPNDGKTYNYGTVDSNEFTIENVKIAKDKKALIEMQLWLSIESGFEGDIALDVTGSAIPHEIEPVVIAKAISPVTVETKVTDVKIGYQYVPTADFTIKETKAGILEKGKTVKVSLSDEISEDMIFTTGTKIDVVGDLKIKNIRTTTNGSARGSSLTETAGTITFDIATASGKASEIKFTNVQIKINRTVPVSNKAPYNIVAWGTAIAENYGMKTDMFQTAGVKAPYIRVITLADDRGQNALARQVEVSIGDPVIKVGNETYTMDTAAYISNASNSTMVPVRFVAVALGIPEEEVMWDYKFRTVTVRNGASTVQFTIDSAQVNINGVYTTMYSPDNLPVAAEIKDDRAFVPFRALGTAFGIPVTWNPETQSAIFNEGMGLNVEQE